MTMDDAVAAFRAAKAEKIAARLNADKAYEMVRMAEVAAVQAFERYEKARDAVMNAAIDQ